MSHLVRSDFQADERVITRSPYESHTGNPAPKATKLLNRILAWVIALYADGTQRHHGEWRENFLDEPEANTRELALALAQMGAVDWRTPKCKTCEKTQYDIG